MQHILTLIYISRRYLFAENCSLNCELGFTKDLITGEDICQCLENSLETVHVSTSATPPLCHNFTGCLNGCTLEIDEGGCSSCTCQELCPEFRLEDCPVECPRGYRYDSNSCLTCQCLHDNENEAANEVSSTSSRPTEARGIYGLPLECSKQTDQDLVSWMDACHECICLKGERYCSLKTCSAVEDNCCGTQDLKLGLCDQSKGPYVQSTKWSNSSSCMECMCSAGTMFCKEQPCSTIKCRGSLMQQDEMCCPSCEMTTADSHRIDTSLTTDYLVTNRKKVSCQIHDVIQPSGSSWWETPCRACECFEGATRCKDVKCPQLDCHGGLHVWQQGRCCPLCVCKTLELVVHCCKRCGSPHVNQRLGCLQIIQVLQLTLF